MSPISGSQSSFSRKGVGWPLLLMANIPGVYVVPAVDSTRVLAYYAIAAGAVVLNVTAVAPTASGYFTVYPCGTQRPNAANLTYAQGQIVSAIGVWAACSKTTLQYVVPTVPPGSPPGTLPDETAPR